MRLQTRHVLFGGGGIIVLGLTAGFAAYIQGGSPALALAQGSPDELRYIPQGSSIVAYANVRDVMYSNFRGRLREVMPDLDGQQEFRDRTGIDIENDIDTVVASLIPPAPGSGDDTPPRGLVVISGRLDATRLEALAREGGGQVEDYHGTRLISAAVGDGQTELAMAFVGPGVIALGSDVAVRQAVDLPSTGGDVTSNDRLMGLMSYVDGSSNAWAIGRLDDPGTLAWLPDQVEAQVPAITAFAVAGRVNGGVSGTITAEARDEVAGQQLHDVLQGLVALARMQTSARPEFAGLLDSLQLTASGTIVSLSFAIPPEILDLIPSQDSDEADGEL